MKKRKTLMRKYTNFSTVIEVRINIGRERSEVMGFWFFMMIMDLLIPFTMIGFGKYFMKSAPGNINIVFGYRTSMSMKNTDTWKFAHEYCGNLWFKWGKISLILTIIAMTFLLGKTVDTIGNWGGTICMIQLLPLIGAIGPTESALRRTFDKDGKRR